MVKKRSAQELDLMRRSGKIAGAALKKAMESSLPGISGLELDELVGDEIIRLGGEWSYKTVPNYPFATCINYNEGVVHGLPSQRKIEVGDIVSVDLAVMYKGWHTDTAWSVVVKDGGAPIADLKKKERFLAIGQEALWLGIKQAVAGNTVGDISAAIQTKIEGSGYFIVRSLVGHGVGKHLHEDPEVPGYGVAGTGLLLEAGMTIAIEVIYTEGTRDVKLDKDGWTYNSADGSLGGLFEMTVIVGENKAEVLTNFSLAHS